MGKKRKAGGRPYGHADSTKYDGSNSKLVINSFEDVADSEDEFHINQDKILLEEGPAQKKQRQIEEEEEFFEPSDEEVLALNEEVSDSEDDLQDAKTPSNLPKARVESSKYKISAPFSDSEASAAAADEDEDAGGWGTSRKDYYNADAIEKEADALEEEAEARRLQQKQLQGMTEEDFGFDEIDWREADKDGQDEDGEAGHRVVREVLPKLEITDAMSPEERLKILRTTYPEFEPLAKEFLALQKIHEASEIAATAALAIRQHALKRVNDSVDVDESETPVAVVKHSALSGYLASLSMYFVLLTSGQTELDAKPSVMPPEELRDHPIIETLVQCRDLWEKVKNITVPKPIEPCDSNLELPNGQNGRLEYNESAPDGLSNKNGTKKTGEKRPKREKTRRSNAEKAAAAAQAEADARRAERLRKTEEGLASLSALSIPTKPSSSPLEAPSAKVKASEDSESDFGEQTTLTAHEAAEKAKHKKSLRFYTSQIAQKTNKRDAAGRDAGGDADIPYRERLKDRQARLNAEAEKRGKKAKGAGRDEPLGGPSDEDDERVANELREGKGGGSGSEDYYEMVASRAAEKKASKAALAAAHAQAEKEGGIVRVVEEEGVDGKRAISYQIAKNKGLAPARKKDVRNPRVKKRKKFEAKKKKLGSIRPVFKGGSGGAYGGELTGIKKGLVKSVKL